MPRSKEAILIENNSQRALVFGSIKELKEYARKHGWKIKRSRWASEWMGLEVYYTENYTILPLFDD